jgi:acetate kinase
VIAAGKAKNVATRTRAEASLSWDIHGIQRQKVIAAATHRVVAESILTLLAEERIKIDALGHRFVHGGTEFKQTTRIEAGTLPRLRACFALAPIHNPNSYQVIEACARVLPDIPQYAVFDTAFHAHLPEAARSYALPAKLVAEYGFRKVGFHGLSYQFVSARAAEWLGKPLAALKLIICHLGTGGASLAAVRDGASLDTSMGYSPLSGLVMSTRCGDLDAEIVLELVRGGMSVDEISHLLNDQSGLLGVSGFSSNLDEIIAEAEKGDANCQLAFDVYVHRLKLYLGAYTWLLNGADAIIFTDEIGMGCWKLRERVCADVENLGILLDQQANRAASVDQIAAIQAPASRTQILLIPTDEERVILDEVVKSWNG